MHEDETGRFVSKLQSIVIISIFVVGLVILAFGFTLEDRFLGGTLQAVGGALLGSAASILLAAILERPAVVQVRNTLIATLGARLLSDNEELERMRRKWHQYHLTVYDGKKVWRYKIVDLSVDSSLNSVAARFQVLDPRTEGKRHVYKVEAGVRGRRVIFLQSRTEGGEDEVVYVYPRMAAGFMRVASGFAFMESWDGQSLVTQTILSSEPLAAIAVGTVPDEHSETITKAWEEGMSGAVQLA
ncbi:hypothetical protein [Brevundimonas sp.]|uniref:hypothetical protein n=1 Tax=Brevundimonas sp. TaxID=1871086 RepID=UPI001DB16DD1|nr:hypothetical protein [Brevundimonas sp.]MBL0946592.1 hypothetical protein [Brevundimonas sp.]